MAAAQERPHGARPPTMMRHSATTIVRPGPHASLAMPPSTLPIHMPTKMAEASRPLSQLPMASSPAIGPMRKGATPPPMPPHSVATSTARHTRRWCMPPASAMSSASSSGICSAALLEVLPTLMGCSTSSHEKEEPGLLVPPSSSGTCSSTMRCGLGCYRSATKARCWRTRVVASFPNMALCPPEYREIRPAMLD
eukprot:scaffold18381_cov79-Phaeocystis_antarctica.AAC.11